MAEEDQRNGASLLPPQQDFYGGVIDFTAAKQQQLLHHQYEENMISAWLMEEEEEDDVGENELWKLLESSSADHPYPVKVKFIDDPYSLPLVFGSSTSYVTINGNEESCGSSFSESDSSLMVGISSIGFKAATAADGAEMAVDGGGAWEETESVGRAVSGSECSGEYDEDMLARFLGEDYYQSQWEEGSGV